MFIKKKNIISFASALILLLGLTMVPDISTAEQPEVSPAPVVVDNAALVDITGKVVEANSERPLANATITLVNLDSEVTSNAEGEFVLTIAHPGTYNIRVTHPQYQVLEKEVELPLPEDESFVLELTPKQ